MLRNNSDENDYFNGCWFGTFQAYFSYCYTGNDALNNSNNELLTDTNNQTVTTPSSTVDTSLGFKIDYSKKLGEGNYGKVYLAESTVNQELFAVKLINLSNASNRKIAECNKEIDIMTTLRNAGASNVVQIHGEFQIDTDNHYIAIAMNYAEQGCLNDWLSIAKYPELLPHNKMEIMLGLANGLTYLHAEKIIHCDIKPGNILIDKNTQPLLCDFGLSKRIDKDDFTSPCGSPIFMAPEVLLNYANYSSLFSNSDKSDVYSLALVYWCIVVGLENPFDDITTLDKLIDTVVTKEEREAIPDSAHCPELIKELINDGWHKNPENRPTAQTLTLILSNANSVSFFSRPAEENKTSAEESHSLVQKL